MYDTYVSIDLETTGLNPKRDRIIEIGAIRVEQGQIAEEFSTFVDPGRKLEERITELIPHHAHRALEDAKATDRLFRKLAELFYQEETGGQASTESVEKKANNNLFEPQPLHFQVKRDTPATKPQKERLYRLAEQHKITLEVDVEKLTRSDASRLADKILAKYGR